MSIQNHYKPHSLTFYNAINRLVKFQVLIMIFTIYLRMFLWKELSEHDEKKNIRLLVNLKEK